MKKRQRRQSLAALILQPGTANAEPGKAKAEPGKAKAESRGKGKCKAQPAGHKAQPAAGRKCKQRPVCASFGTLFVTQATSQSYIQVVSAETGHKVCLVGAWGKRFPQHRETIVSIVSWLVRQPAGLTKEDVQEYRETLAQ